MRRLTFKTDNRNKTGWLPYRVPVGRIIAIAVTNNYTFLGAVAGPTMLAFNGQERPAISFQISDGGEDAALRYVDEACSGTVEVYTTAGQVNAIFTFFYSDEDTKFQFNS